MAEEQIKQNAHDYTYTNDHNWTWDDSGKSRVDISTEISDAYLAGAHSRDEEIESLQKQIVYLSQREQMLFDREVELIAENDQLRNPWISVEDRLPDREETFLCALDNGVYVTDCYDYGRNKWNSFPDSITHWMPIPTIPKLDKEE